MKRTLLLGLVVVAPLTLTGCGSGRHNAQYLEHSVVTGVSASIEGLSIRNAYFTTPVAKGGTAVLTFSVYADTRAAATQLVSVTSGKLSAGTPAELSTVTAGVTKVASAVPIDFQSGPGANIAAATFSDVAVPLLSATYSDVTFTFANNLTETLQVPVAQTGAVDPLSTAIPSTFPEQPFPLRTSLPGEGGAGSAP